MEENKKVAMVLSGGGTKGSYQAGVIYQLLNKGIQPDVIYGTSAGAINALGTSYLGINLIDYWLDLKNMSDVFYPTGWKRYIMWTKLFKSTGFYSLFPLRKKLEDIVKGRISSMEAVACYVDLVSGSTNFCYSSKVSKIEFVDAVISSASIPVIMEANHNSVDGGVRHHTPLGKAIADGADIVYVILCKPWAINPSAWQPISYVPPVVNVAVRSIDDIMSHEIMLSDLKMCNIYNKAPELFGKKKIELHVYAPDREWMGVTEINPAKIKLAVEAGKVSEEMPQDYYI